MRMRCCDFLVTASSLGSDSDARGRAILWNPRVGMASLLVRCIPNSNAPCTFESPRPSLRVLSQKARFVARRKESISVRQLERPLIEYMRLPASQYSVLDAERIERVNEDTFRCYVYRIKFFTLEVCPVLLVKVEEQPDGCCIKLLSCKLEGSPVVAAQNEKFDAIMVNRISCDSDSDKSLMQQITSDTVIEVSIDLPFAFQAIPKQAMESAGTQVLDQILKIMLPRFMSQLVKDYEAWASGDTSRQPLGTGEI
ncbi:uncharacterized protein LOC130733184 [Lotus japonicus]|uniref:uncharacterized protein LOC130733184 n=2 Tax=Lotus japonicus TaxID=34305 RepID=UPI002590E79C|nr:uncharacterized protein LOC130733184 [Lotus japonicus]